MAWLSLWCPRCLAVVGGRAVANAWLVATLARDAVAGQLWAFGAGLGLLIRLSPARYRAWAMAALALLLVLIWRWG